MAKRLEVPYPSSLAIRESPALGPLELSEEDPAVRQYRQTVGYARRESGIELQGNPAGQADSVPEIFFNHALFFA